MPLDNDKTKLPLIGEINCLPATFRSYQYINNNNPKLGNIEGPDSYRIWRPLLYKYISIHIHNLFINLYP